MKKHLVYVYTCTLLLFLLSCSQKEILPVRKGVVSNTNIAIGKIDSIYSEILGEEREIWVHVPRSARESTNPNKKYPVLYLLDGNTHFHSTTALVQHLARNKKIPEMIIVGIPNTNRTLDLTPTPMSISRDGDVLPPGINGGGENFTQFLQKELIPYVEKKYAATRYRTLIGHSFGGLLTVNTLINHPDIFDSYIAIDPSLWWDNRALLKSSITVLEQKNFERKSLFLAVANTMRDGMDITKVEKDTSLSTDHIRSILKFKQTGIQNSQNQLYFDWKYYPKEHHGSIPLIASYDGLKSLFSWYEFDINAAIRKPKVTPEYLINYIEQHYATVSKHFGYTVKPDENFINQLGYRFLSPKPSSSAKAFAFFSLNIKNYPKSANAYDSMGDYYESQSNTTKAIEMFTKSYAIGKNESTKRKLDRLKAH